MRVQQVSFVIIKLIGIIMKNFGFIFLVFIICLAFYACNKVESSLNGTGKLKLTIIQSVEVYEYGTKLKSLQVTEDFKVIIYQSSGNEVLVKEYEKASDMPDEIELESGEYYIVAHSDNLVPAAFNNPYYYGISEVFTIDPEVQESITVNCELANCMVTVVYSQNVLDNFSECATLVSTSEGSLTFTKDEIRAGYFDLKPISIDVTLTYSTTTGTATKNLSGNISDPQAKKHYEIHIDAALTGQASILLNIDENVTTETIFITETQTGEVNPGDILITEIMYDPDTLSDYVGEWFEIYNTTDSTINLKNLVIKCNDKNPHIITDSINLAPDTYFVLARSDTATTAIKYVYGSSITLTNSSTNLILANYGTDGSNGSEIAGVFYDESNGFPAGNGASIQLNPLYYNVSDAKLGSSWCLSTISFDTGDLGTPGVTNTDCN